MNALARSRLFAYASLLLVQAAALRGIDRFRDLSAGDTAHYFESASWWADAFRTNPLWSPLYQVFYGTVLRVLHDPFAATTVHRVLIVAAADVLVLAVFRGLLPHALAWLLAAWFALLPVNFDTLYEVHLFAALPVLLAVAVVERAPGRGGRAAALGILAASTLLVRNELLIASFLFALYVALRERRAPRPALRACGVALLVAAAVGALAWVRPIYALRRVPNMLHDKHALNVCQIYAFGYAQRHADFGGDPWTGCQALMRRDFGKGEPTMAEAFRANPRAALAHVAWNARLVPAGVELQLFGAISGRFSPDYVEPRRSPLPALLLALAAALLAAGAFLALRDRARWGAFFAARGDAWALLGCLSASAVAVMLTQRPRPSYLFPEAVALMAAIGTAAYVVASRLAPKADLSRLLPAGVAFVLALVLVRPPHYRADAPQAFGQRGQPLRQAVERLLPLRRDLAGAHTLAVRAFPYETCAYVGGTAPCNGIAVAAPSLAGVEARGADWIYADEEALADPAWRGLLDAASASGRWRRVASREGWAAWRR